MPGNENNAGFLGEVLERLVRDHPPHLNVRQLAILNIVHAAPPPHTVRGLSARLAIGKPAITRALDVLEDHGFLKRQKDPKDRRSILIIPTKAGQKYVSKLSGMIARTAREISPW